MAERDTVVIQLFPRGGKADACRPGPCPKAPSGAVLIWPERSPKRRLPEASSDSRLKPGMPAYEAIVQEAIERAERRGW